MGMLESSTDKNRSPENSLIKHFRAVFLAAAIGDILGMPVEGWKPSQIKRHIGSIIQPIAPILEPNEDEDGKLPHISFNLCLGQWTDDTKLLVLTARSLIEHGYDLLSLARDSVVLYENEPQVRGNEWGSFGRTTSEAFENLRRGVAPDRSATSKGIGNAPALKMAPVG